MQSLGHQKVRARVFYLGKQNEVLPNLNKLCLYRMRILSSIADGVDQGGKRKGQFLINLPPWHPDFPDFIQCRKPSSDNSRFFPSLPLCAWVPNIFMERVKKQ